MKVKLCLLSIYSALLCITVVSCNNETKGGDDVTKLATELATNFATDYFNYKLDKAASCCTTEAKEQIYYLATNLTEEDVSILRDKKEAATCEVDGIRLINDSCAEATCIIKDSYIKDTIGTRGKVLDKRNYSILIVRTGNKWLIRKVSQLQNEKPSHG